MESSPEEEAIDAAKVADKVVTEVGTENPNPNEIPVEPMITDDNAVTLSESNKVKETADKEAALALSGGHLGKSPKEVARLSQVKGEAAKTSLVIKMVPSSSYCWLILKSFDKFH